MKKRQRSYEPHLAIKHLSLLPGREWLPPENSWSLIQVGSGNGYCLQASRSMAVETGAVLAVAGRAQAVIRASRLGEMALHTFNVMPGRLTGLISLGEEEFLKLAAEKENAIRLLPPDSPVARQMQELSSCQRPAGLALRLKLLQLFVEALGGELGETAVTRETTDSKERLRLLLQQTPLGELVEMSFSELARKTNCTSRHLSRIFQELAGMSFRDKRAEVRMARARELLANSNSKVVEVAFESGYKSLSLFNLVFARHFGTSPGRWRQKYNYQGVTENSPRQKTVVIGGLPSLKKALDVSRINA